MRLSDKKKEKISEQILALLYSHNPKFLFTFNIAQELARDEEFTKKLLISLKAKQLVVEIKRNPKGVAYSRRSRWKLSDKTYVAYKRINDT